MFGMLTPSAREIIEVVMAVVTVVLVFGLGLGILIGAIV